MSDALIKKLYSQNYQKYIYNLKMNRSDKVLYYTGILDILKKEFIPLTTIIQTDIDAIEAKAEAEALEDIEFYN